MFKFLRQFLQQDSFCIEVGVHINGKILWHRLHEGVPPKKDQIIAVEGNKFVVVDSFFDPPCKGHCLVTKVVGVDKTGGMW